MNLREIIETRNITTLYQPIVLMKTGKILGFEALTRGPVGTEYEHPEFLFKVARKFNLTMELEELCIKNAIEMSKHWNDEILLFINIESSTITNLIKPEGDMIVPLLNNNKNVILEITERNAIENLSLFKKLLDYLRQAGLKFALDDVGNGYACLELIAYLKPEYVKIDGKLVSGISRDFLKKEIVKTFVDFSRKMGSKVIAEAIEIPEDCKIVDNINVEYAQGFYFSKPRENFFINDYFQIQNKIKNINKK